MQIVLLQFAYKHNVSNKDVKIAILIIRSYDLTSLVYLNDHNPKSASDKTNPKIVKTYEVSVYIFK